MRRFTAVILAAAVAAIAAAAQAETPPEIVVQVGHGDVVRAAAISPNGHDLASGSMDGTVKLWEAQTGRLIRTFAGHPEGVRAVAFGPEGKRLLSGGMDRTVKVWDAETGALVRVLKGPNGAMTFLAVSPDSGRVAAGSEDGSVWVWAMDTGDSLRSFGAHPNGAAGGAFAPDGRLVTGGADGAVKVWQPGDASPQQVFSGHGGAVTSVAISPDGARIASGGEDGAVRLWDLAKGTALWTASGHDQPVQSVAFSADGRAVISGSWDGTVRLWSAAAGDSIGHIAMGQAVGIVGTGPEGEILSGGGDNRVTLWSVQGEPIRRFEGQGTWVYGTAVSADGFYLATGSRDGCVRLWDISEGRMLRKLDAHAAAAVSVAFSPDGRQIVSGGGDGLVKVWDLASGRLVHTLAGHEAWVYGTAVSPDGKWAVSGSADETILVWDLESGESVRTIEGHGGEVTSVAVTPDGRRIVSASGDETVRVWDLATGAELKTLAGHTGWVFCAAVTPDGARVISGSEDGTVRIWDLESGEELHRLDIGSGALSLTISPDGKAATAGTMDGRLIRVALDSVRIVESIAAHTRRVYGAASSPDGAYVYSGSWDGSVKVWDAAGGERVSLMGFRTGDWIISTPEGYYTCSIDGSRYVAWRVGRKVFPFERYEDVYRKPDVVRERLSVRAPTGAIDVPPAPSTVGAPPRVQVLEPAHGATTQEEYIEVLVEAEDEVEVKSVKVSVNGRPPTETVQRGLRTRSAGGKVKRIPLKVRLFHGENRIVVTAVNAAGLQSDPDTITVARRVPGASPGDLWVLSVGVSEHSNPRYSLRYPSVDATSIADALRERAGPLYRNVHVTVLVDKDSTTPKIQAALEEIADKIGREDAMMMFIAGHGVRTKRGEYFFITHDGNPARIRETAFSWKGFEELLRRIPARSILLFADTCHSGDIVKPGSRYAGSEEMSERLVKDAGVAVFVSSQGCEYSLESKAWGHGAFTYALLEGLAGKANFIADEWITITEVQLYVPTRVRKLTKNQQHPRIPRFDNFDPEMPLVVAK